MLRFLVTLVENSGALSLAGLGLVLFGVVIGAVGSRTGWRLVRYLSVVILLSGTIALLGGIFGAAFGLIYPILALNLLFGLLVIGLAICILLLEVRRKAAIKQGGLILAIGLLISVASLLLPVLPGQSASPPYQPPTPTVIPSTRTPPPSRTPITTRTPSAIPTETYTPSPLPSLTLTPTRGLPNADSPVVDGQATENNSILPTSAGLATEIRSTTPALTATLSACTLQPFRNVNLRDQPDPAARLITTIPFESPLTGIGQTKDWWQVTFNGQTGWVIKTYVTAQPGCAKLPILTGLP